MLYMYMENDPEKWANLILEKIALNDREKI